MQPPPAPVLTERVRSLPATVALLERTGESAPLYVVGGAVRDVALGGLPVDLDLVVEGDAAALAARIAGSQKPRFHDRFGTSTVVLGAFTYDIARARTERYPRPGALPEVEPASIETDLLRRDFTVNAIAVGIAATRTGEIHAVPTAFADLAAERLRVLHAESFVDDPTRLFRLARYAGRLDFAIESGTEALARSAIAAGAVWTVSGSRIGTELRLLAREPDPIDAFGALRGLQLDEAVARGFALVAPESARRALALLPADGRPDRLVLAAASTGLAPEPRRLWALLDSLGFKAADREVIVTAAERAPAIAARLTDAQTPSQIAAAVAGAPPEAVALAGALGPAAAARQWLERLRHVRLEIGGEELIAAGVPRGPAIGRGLRAALAAKLDGRAANREAELCQALRAARTSG